MSACTPREFDIGALINNDEIFSLARRKLHPETMLEGPLKRLVEIMIEYGNRIEDIMRVDKVMAIYAMELSNHVARWQIQLKEESYESLKEEKIMDDTLENKVKNWLPEAQRKYAKGKSYDFLCLYLKMFLEGTYTREKIEALRNAKDNFESYCETMESKS